ncbi:cyclic di-GMP phosphodiesterase response regulator RpfG [bacterium BMS3Bbin14]|nr:cyclic di-GMP phosphodiesterase response regulator RpfG [bacterium BMS3Bbin14]
MERGISVNLGNFLLSLSDAMDLASPEMAQHQQRTAFIAWEISKTAGLSEKMMEDIFVASLLHDIGFFRVEEKLAFIRFERDDTNPHCMRGAFLLKQIPFLSDKSDLVRFHHREWRHWHEPIDTSYVLGSQIISLADYVERLVNRDHYILHQHDQVIAKIISLSGKTFHPDIVDLFVRTARREEFWLDLASPRLYSILLHTGPYKSKEIDILGISPIAKTFKSIIDFKSKFTSTHSTGVSACAVKISSIFGLTDTEIQLMGVAGDLHDLGKLAIPEKILEKEGKLTREEFAVIKSHTYFTYSLINTIAGLKQIAQWAAYHHEKLDGSGYPFRCVAAELDTKARIMAVADIFTAVAEDRPYRPGMSKKEVIRILKQQAEKGLLDSRIVNLLLDNYHDIFTYVAGEQAKALELYEEQFKQPANET